jgi:hypothetical protein
MQRRTCVFTNSASDPRVRLSSSTNTQSLPSHRLTISPSQSSSTHVPSAYSSTWEVSHETRNVMTAMSSVSGMAVLMACSRSSPHRLLVQALVEQLRVSLQAIERFDAETTTRSDPPGAEDDTLSRNGTWARVVLLGLRQERPQRRSEVAEGLMGSARFDGPVPPAQRIEDHHDTDPDAIDHG